MKSKIPIKIRFFSRGKIIAFIVFLAVLGSVFWGYGNIYSKKGIQYRTITAKAGDFAIEVSGIGNVIVDQSSAVEPTIGGTVADLSVNIGDKVEKGQFLFGIINDELGVDESKAYASYAQSLQALEAAKAEKKQAKYDYKEGKVKQRSALKQKIESAEAAILSAEKSVSSSLEFYQNEKTDAGKRKVTAPIAGTINAINIKNGDNLNKLSSGSSRIVPIIIGDMETLKAQVQVNEVDITDVDVGQKVRMTFNAIDDFLATGHVEKIDSLGIIVSGVVTFNVTVGFDNIDPRIKPQMTVSASIAKETKKNTISIPNSAIKNENNNHYVEVLKGETPERRKIKIGDSNNMHSEIISGIEEGEQVIIQTINPKKINTSSSQNGGLIPGTGGRRSGLPHIR